MRYTYIFTTSTHTLNFDILSNSVKLIKYRKNSFVLEFPFPLTH